MLNVDVFLVIDCGRPMDIENGRVIVVNESTVYGGSAEYHCVPHYNRIGPYLRKCMDDGKWSGEEPRCECEYCMIFVGSLSMFRIQKLMRHL